jgi:AraC-like DNA-binding protein
VEQLVSVHYFEYTSHYYFEGEQHDFWELLYVDKGALDVQAGDVVHHLEKGQLIFHKPGEFHALRACGVSPNLVVVSFVCHGQAMRFFEGCIVQAGDAERALMARIVEEASSAFSTPLNDPTVMQLVRAPDAPFGCEQLIANAIEQLLIGLVRRETQGQATTPPTSLIRERSQQDFVEHVTRYLEENLGSKLTLADVCRDNLVGRSYLQKIFREKTGGGVMEYFGMLKIEAAKQKIRDGSHNFTEIASMLGYNSIHYFSRHFKKVTGMTPSEYASSVKVLSSKNRVE